MGLITILAMLTVSVPANAAKDTRLLTSFEAADDLKALRAHEASIQPLARHATDGSTALEVTFKPAEWPNVKMVAPTPWDWSGFDGLALDITNPGSTSIDFGVRADDDLTGGPQHWRQGSGNLKPGESATCVLPLGLGLDPMTYGMRGLPTPPGMRGLRGDRSKPINLAHLMAFQVFMHKPAAPTVLVLDNIRLVHSSRPLDRIVDQFGQYANADWPGKLKNASEFAKRLATERKELKSHQALPDRDHYDGWRKGPKLKASGFFRTEKVKDKWWLITPEGRPFWSIGIDCVGTEASTITTGRENMFSWLPVTGDPLSRHAGQVKNVHMGPVKEGATFNFYAANLQRKFGPDYLQPWSDMTLLRLRSWGFNTIANWSDRRFYGNGRVPYVATVHIGGNHGRLSSGSDYWGKMHDPYDPQFAESTAKAIRPVAEKVRNDPWCIGYFVDNELSWGGFGDEAGRSGLARGALAESSASHAKKAFLSQLKAEYGSIDRLNEAWGTKLANWETLDQPYKHQGNETEAMTADMRAFVKDLARRYFTIVRDEIRRLDPNHLYMGCRFAWQTEEAVQASAEICDVVSFNIYAVTPEPKRMAAVEPSDKPCILGEFHFGALDRGMFHTGLVAVSDQKARAAMYRDYVEHALDNPMVVGCHWFQYLDQPLTGRSYDGENYNIGFVTVTDTPYPEMVEAAREVHADAYARRWGKAVQ
jgi:hypothetical protein